MTLNQLVDNILLIARNNNIAESEHLSRIQIGKVDHRLQGYVD